MKVKTIIGVIFLLVFSINLKGQDYAPFPTSTATWQEASRYIGLGFDAWTTIDYVMSGDTAISEVNYKKIYAHTNYNGGPIQLYIGGLREDENKRIFFKPDSMITGDSYDDSSWANDVEPLLFPSDSIEYLIYDFSQMEIGDTLFYNNSLRPDYYNVVLDTDSILVGESYSKTYVVSDYSLWSGWGGTSILIEGIGSSKGLLAPFKTSHQFVPFLRYQLNCFTHESIFFENPFEEEVIDCQVGLNITENQESSFTLFPNPCATKLHIQFQNRGSSEVNIYNSIGGLVFSERIDKNESDVDVSLFKPGVYTLVVNGENSASKRFVKE